MDQALSDSEDDDDIADPDFTLMDQSESKSVDDNDLPCPKRLPSLERSSEFQDKSNEGESTFIFMHAENKGVFVSASTLATEDKYRRFQKSCAPCLRLF